LGVLVVSAAYSYWNTVELSKFQVGQGYVTQAQANKYFLGWYLSHFCLNTPFMFFFLTSLGLPALLALRRIGFVSVFGAILASQILALLLSLYPLLFPYNSWCSENPMQCFSRQYWETTVLAAAMALSFGTASRLPWFKGPRYAG